MKNNIIVFGILVQDQIAHVENFSQPGETVIAKSFVTSLGGKGTNQAIGIKKFGGDVIFSTCIGNDSLAKELEAKLFDFGINSKYLFRENEASGVAMISVDKFGQNSIVVCPNVNNNFSDKHVKLLEDEFKNAKYVIVQYELPLKTLSTIFQLAKNNNVEVIVNPAPAHVIESSLYTYVDYFIPNETELDFLVKDNTITLEEKIQKLYSETKIKNIIVTLGSKGVVWYCNSIFKYFSAPVVEVVDTVGAGDCFISAFATCLQKGKSIDFAIDFAINAASLSVTKSGAADSIPVLKIN